MSLLPSLREKRRYLVFELISKTAIRDFKVVAQHIMAGCLAFLGQLGMAKAGIRILPKAWKPELQRGIISVSHRYLDDLRAALLFIEHINGKEVIIRSVKASGTLKKANYYLKSGG